jgi:tetratricopeptide (TPR) repeat protein
MGVQMKWAPAFVVLWVLAWGARADDADQQARARYAEGDTALRLGQYAKAIEAFEDAYRLSHRVEILYNIGLAYRRAYSVDGEPEHLRRALDLYETFMRQTPSENERKVTGGVVKELREQLAAVEERERLSRLRNVTSPQLQDALKLFVSGKGPEALERLDKLLEAGSHPQGMVEDIFRLEGEIAADIGQPASAEEAFKKLLALAPGFVVSPKASALVRTAFANSTAYWKGKAALHISHGAPPPAVPDRPLSIPVSVDQDPMLMVARVTVHYRVAGQGSFATVTRTGPGDLLIPGPALPTTPNGYRVEYYIEAADRFGNVLATIGGERVPLSFPVISQAEVERQAEAAKPWYKRPWIWALVVVGVGGATTAGVLLSQRGPPASDYGVVQTLPH